MSTITSSGDRSAPFGRGGSWIVQSEAFGTRATKAIIDPDSAEETGSIEEPESAVFNSDVKNIMLNNCITCHGGPAPSAGIDLNTYSVVRQQAEFGNLVQRMNSTTSPMPTSGILPQETRAIIDKWAADGFPEN